MQLFGFVKASFINVCIGGVIGSGTESDSDESVPDLEEQDSAQTQTQQAQVRPVFQLSQQTNVYYKTFVSEF